MKLTKIQEKWLTALESGKYAQGTGRLKSCEGYCCLGVACELMGMRSEIKQYDNYFYYDDSFNDFEMPGESWLEIGLRDAIGSFLTETYEEISLSEMNDSGMTFKEIAAYIRANPDNVFQMTEPEEPSEMDQAHETKAALALLQDNTAIRMVALERRLERELTDE